MGYKVKEYFVLWKGQDSNLHGTKTPVRQLNAFSQGASIQFRHLSLLMLLNPASYSHTCYVQR